MNKYLVEYFYHATGMDYPDRQTKGIFEANSQEEAIQKCLDENYKHIQGEGSGIYETRESVLNWIKGCLVAHELK